MAVDNPSYFSLAGGGAGPVGAAAVTAAQSHPRGLASLFRRRPDKMGVASSASVVSTSTSSTLTHHESNRSSTSGTSAPSTPTEEFHPMLPQNGNGCSSLSSSHRSSQRRSFRNLFRSVSANTESEKTQQFLNGDPRPSDVAPPSPYLPHRSHSHSENDRCRPGRKKVLKSASELLSNDMVYCGLPGEEPGVDSEANEEVFLGVDDARYYNLSATLPTPGSAAAGRRRHSIGTFLNKDGNFSRSSACTPPTSPVSKTAEPLREPEMMAPPVPTELKDTREVERNDAKAAKPSRRRRHKSASSKESRSIPTPFTPDTMAEDVVFVSSKESEAASLWVNYLTACFEHISRGQGRPPFKMHHITVEEAMPPEIEGKINTARLQIIVVCPVLLECVIAKPAQASSLAKRMVPDRVLTMMLGVHDGHLTENHKAALISYTQWKKFFVKDQDETFVSVFVGAALAILGTAPPSSLKSDKTMFSVIPKKVKMGQSKIIALLNEPLRPEDVVSVIVDRCGDAIEVDHVKRRNPFTLQFSIPDRCLEMSMLVGVRISKNGTPLGVKQVKCESRLRELDQILRANDNPLEFMCQTLGFNSGDREQLDNWMVHAFQKNLPPHFNLLSAPNGMVPSHKNHTSPEENPTLLHFAARFGLEKLAWQLMECPGGDLACDLKNIADLTPADLAEQAGHAKLGQALRGYMQMNEFTNIYSYLKVMSESSSTPTPTTETQTDENQEDYSRPRSLSDAYLVPPAARPVVPMGRKLPSLNPISPTAKSISGTSMFTTNATIEANYSIAPAPMPVITPPTPTMNSNDFNEPSPEYMEMHPAVLKTSRLESPSEPSREEATPTPPLYSRTNGTKSREPSGPQDELLEIINDFKNNVFTISEVEQLVDTWRNRNDVQQSFKEKQKQLQAMRQEYDRIQKLMKEDMKRATPFDTIRKFFTKNRKDSKEISPATNKTEGANSTVSPHRPASSLSLHSVSSFSSSGRMSTASGGSGTSLGDSGTHSDPEDRKLHPVDKGRIMSYEIPPPPKPYMERYSPVRDASLPRGSNRALPHATLDNRPPEPMPRPEDSEYYIVFPPSGLPIHDFEPDGTVKEIQTPGTPDHPEYLVLGETDVPSNSMNSIDPSPPPGMCIPNEYMKLSPETQSTPASETQTNIGISLSEFMARRHMIDQMPMRTFNSTDSFACTQLSDVPEGRSSPPIHEEYPASSFCGDKEDVSQSAAEYVESDAIDRDLAEEPDDPDTSDVPEYMNLPIPSTKVGLPAPPLPPRMPLRK